MIRRDTMTPADGFPLWENLSAEFPRSVIEWRQDGRPIQRDGRYFARFVAYLEANTVRERLDEVCPGEWDLTLELLPRLADEDGVAGALCAFRARLQILGVVREDIGQGRDYKQAATDAFKRAAVRFGIGHELYSFGMNWVPVDSDGKYPKPFEDPGVCYFRRADLKGTEAEPSPGPESSPPSATVPPSDDPSVYGAGGPRAIDEVSCPKCGGRTWDNRLTKRNPKAPDYKCRNRSCDGVVWPARPNAAGIGPDDEIEGYDGDNA